MLEGGSSGRRERFTESPSEKLSIIRFIINQRQPGKPQFRPVEADFVRTGSSGRRFGGSRENRDRRGPRDSSSGVCQSGQIRIEGADAAPSICSVGSLTKPSGSSSDRSSCPWLPLCRRYSGRCSRPRLPRSLSPGRTYSSESHSGLLIRCCSGTPVRL